jgi:hypothetical protein
MFSSVHRLNFARICLRCTHCKIAFLYLIVVHSVGSQVTFLGFLSKSDEWLSLASVRLAPLNSLSFGRRGTIVDVPLTLETDQEREFDPTPDVQGKGFFVQERQSNSATQKGPVVLSMVNQFFSFSHVVEHLVRKFEDVHTSFAWCAETLFCLSKFTECYTDIMSKYDA